MSLLAGAFPFPPQPQFDIRRHLLFTVRAGLRRISCRQAVMWPSQKRRQGRAARHGRAIGSEGASGLLHEALRQDRRAHRWGLPRTPRSCRGNPTHHRVSQLVARSRHHWHRRTANRISRTIRSQWFPHSGASDEARATTRSVRSHNDPDGTRTYPSRRGASAEGESGPLLDFQSMVSPT